MIIYDPFGLINLEIEGLLAFIYILIFPMFFFDGNWKRKITIIILNFILFAVADMLNNALLIPLISPFLNTYYPNMGSQLYSSLTTLPSNIFLFYLSFFIISLNQKEKTILPARYRIASIITFIITGVMAFIFLHLHAYLQNVLANLVLAMIACVLLLLWLTVYLMFYYIGRFSYKESQLQLLSYQNEMIEKFVLQKHESEEMLQILSHDLKHHLQLWQMQAAEAGNIQTAKDITAYSESFMKYELINVRHNTANAIINQKKMECVKNHIPLTVKGAFDSDLMVGKADLLTLLCNLLDNAIEAALQVEDKALRRISLSIKRKNHFLLLEIENSYQIEPVTKNSVLISSKPTGRCMESAC